MTDYEKKLLSIWFDENYYNIMPFEDFVKWAEATKKFEHLKN